LQPPTLPEPAFAISAWSSGSGSAGCGIAEKIVALMVDDGLTESEARRRIFMVDRFGLLTDDMTNLLDFQKNLLTAREDIRDWQVESNNISLMEVVKNAHPTVMIGVSGQPGLFSEEIVKEMHPLPASDYYAALEPDIARRSTAAGSDRMDAGCRAVATGSPFAPVFWQNAV
jgi:malate dehydrogenase (oxaloacetate-decarboxylating)